MPSNSEDYHIFKPSGDLVGPFGKRVALVLAVLVFVLAFVAVTFYDKLLAPIEPIDITTREFAFITTNSDRDFISRVKINRFIGEHHTTTFSTPDGLIIGNTHNQKGEIALGGNTFVYPDRFGRTVIYSLGSEVSRIINTTGDYLVSDNKLFIASSNSLQEYDLFTGASLWEASFSGAQLVDVSPFAGNILVYLRYLLPENVICPVRLGSSGGVELAIDCTQINISTAAGTPTSSVHALILLDAGSGEQIGSFSILGGAEDTSAHIGTSRAYLFQRMPTDNVSLMYNFFVGEAVNLLPGDVVTRVQRVSAMTLTNEAKTLEIGLLINNYLQSLEPADYNDFVSKYVSQLERYSEENMAYTSNSGVVVLDHKLNVERITSIDGLADAAVAYEYSGDLYLVATQTAPATSGVLRQVLHRYGAGGHKLFELPGRTTSLAFSGNRLVMRVGSNIVTYRLTDPKAPELTLPEGSVVININDNRLMALTRKGAEQTSIALYSNQGSILAASDTLTINEPIDDIISNSNIISTDGNGYLFLSSSRQEYLFSFADDKLIASLVSLSKREPVRSFFAHNRLYILGEEIVKLDLP